jgi:hypothetical protein
LNLDLSKVPTSQKAKVKNDVGEFVVNEILRFVETGNSPVEGRGKFKSLNPEYAENEKGGNRTPNLELQGDMLDSLTHQNRSGDSIEIGIWGKEAPKADGHNNFSGESRLPVRRFIPDEDEAFKANIQAGIRDIIARNSVQDEPDNEFRFEPSVQTVRQGDTIEIDVADLLSSDLFGGLFG